MNITTSVTVVLSIIVVLQLLITLGLARRLRVHTDLLNELIDHRARALPAGTATPAFTARTTTGRSFGDADLHHPAAIALLAVDCPHCRTNLPDFVTYVRAAGYPIDQVLAVVSSGDSTDPADRDAIIDALEPVATVISENTIGADTVSTAFDAQAFPTFYLTGHDARVIAGVNAVGKLPDATIDRPVPAAAAPGPHSHRH